VNVRARIHVRVRACSCVCVCVCVCVCARVSSVKSENALGVARTDRQSRAFARVHTVGDACVSSFKSENALGVARTDRQLRVFACVHTAGDQLTVKSFLANLSSSVCVCTVNLTMSCSERKRQTQ